MKEQQKRKIQQFHPEIEDGTDLRRWPPPHTDPVPPNISHYRPILTQYHHISMSLYKDQNINERFALFTWSSYLQPLSLRATGP